MSFRIHSQSPTDLVEEAFFRIQREQMTDVPILNPALMVEAIDFQRWQGDWLGIVITPWCMSILLLPGSQENWISAGQNKRRFVKFPAGDFAFLGGVEPELGEYQSCSLFSPMDKFPTQREATQTARASLIGLLSAPVTEPASGKEKQNEKPSLSRRRFFAMR